MSLRVNEQVQKEYQNVEYSTNWLCLKRKLNKVKGKREIFIGIPDPAVVNNRIETSKYNLVTFLPKNLLVQFSKLANIYFIFVGICQMIPAFSTTNGQPLVYMPLGLVIVMSMIKDFVEDRKRKAQDDLENNSIAERLNLESNKFLQVPWRSIRIGDIIKVKEDEKFPADIAILSSSTDKGTCFIETKNLDGETNLKFRQSCSARLFQKHCDFNTLENCCRFSLTYEDPNSEIHSFSGVLIDKTEENTNNNSSSNRHLLGIQNICLRGCILKRTHWVTGVVIYTGHDCKALKYANIPKYKFGSVEKKMSFMVLEVFCILIIISSLTAIYYAIWWHSHEKEINYYLMISDYSFIENFILHIPMWLLLLNTFVPISLLVTLEIVRYLQGQFLQMDTTFKSQNNESEPIGVASSNLLDELGTVRYILTDKTGTLTCNSMKFKALTVGEDLYEHSRYDDNGILESEQLKAKLAEPQNFPIEFEIFICMNLCHSLIVEEKNGKKQYSGSSSDEECIMEFCVSCGVFYEGIDENKIMTVKNTLNNRIYQYRVVSVREYSSDLGKMSILVEDLQDKTFKTYTKGASNKIFRSLRSDQKEKQEKTEKHIDHFAREILRTLCYSKRTLTYEEISHFMAEEKKLTDGSKCINVHEIQQQLFRAIENEQVLLGGSGVNDEFSDSVESTLQNLKKAGIKIWMITGDKRETGVSVAFKCSIIEKNFVLKYIDDWKSQNFDQVNSSIEECVELASDSDQKYSLAISGITLAKITNAFNKTLINKLSQALQGAQSVVAYNFSPHQKAQLLLILKASVPKQTILAIGDGANDVSMIQAANVGIGIRGKEGREAAKSADFTMCQFKHLNRLLLYVGQETYRKNSHTIFYNFYKNQAWNLAYIWYNFSCGQSGTNIYDQMVTQFYNLLYVSLPIIIYALFDEMHPTNKYFSFEKKQLNILEIQPSIYKKHAAKPSFDHYHFWKWFAHGSAHSVVNIFAAFFIFNASSDKDQRPIDFYTQGLHAFTSCVIVCNLKVMQLHHTHYPFSYFFIFGSIGVYIVSIYILCNINSLDSAGDFSVLFGNINSYLGFAFTIMVCYGFDSAYYILRSHTKQHLENKNGVSSKQNLLTNGDKEICIPLDSLSSNTTTAVNLNDESFRDNIKQNLLQESIDEQFCEGSEVPEHLQSVDAISKQLISPDQNISKYQNKPYQPMKIHPALKVPFSTIDGIQQDQNSSINNQENAE